MTERSPAENPSPIQWLVSDSKGALVLRYLAVFVVAAGYFALLSASSHKLLTWDGFYHIKYAEIMRTETLVPRIPWLPYTVGGRLGVDHHWLFHVLLMPFTFGDLTLGLRLGAIIFAAFSALSVYWFLTRVGASYPMLWTLLLLVSSELLLVRFMMGRAGTLGMPLMLAYLAALHAEHRRAIVAVCFVFMLAYGISALMIPIAFLFAGIVYAQERRIAWQPVLFTVIGLALGLVINPNFPQNVEFTLFHTFMVLKKSSRGGEWYPLDTWQLLKDCYPLALVSGATLLAAVQRPTRILRDTWLICGVTLMFFVMTLRYSRFIEYWAPFATLSNALLLRDAGVWRDLQQRWSLTGRRLATAIAVICLVSIGALRVDKHGQRTDKEGFAPERFAKAGAWLRKHTKRNSVVFNFTYDSFPQLLFHNSHNYYVSGLDPGWLQSESPKLGALYAAISTGRYRGNYSAAIKTHFKARYVVGPAFYPFVHLLQSKGLKLRYATRHAFVFEVAAP